MKSTSKGSSASVTRRQFVVTMLAAGFAAAVRPIAAQTAITTDTKGLSAGEVKIPVVDGEVPAYYARPMRGTSFPTVLVVQEIFGVHEHIKDICRRLAKLGCLAVAPELYARQGDPSKLTDTRALVALAAKVPDQQVLSDLDATAAWAGNNHGDAKRLGITGFCWGGRIVWLYAAHNPQLKAGVAWYGRLEGPRDVLHPQNPVDIARELKAPVLGLYGGADQSIPVSSIEKMRALLASAGNPSQIVVYPGAPHAFNADYRPSYREQPAHDGWRRLQEWFKTYGVA